MDASIISILVNGGLASVSLVSLWIVYKLASNHHHHTDAIIKDHTESNNKLATILGSHSEVLRRLHDTIEKKF